MSSPATNGHDRPGGDMAFPMFGATPAHIGFTKRESIAARLMAAIVGADPEIEHEFAAAEAVRYADALLLELRRHA